MSLSELGNEPTFQNFVQGTVGEFKTPAGTVSYLMTKARLGADATDPERRLTQHLSPFREVIPAEELDFSQLLQRDLDDHRVAVNLIPYLLSPDTTGPAFFPPIIAIALPFDNQTPSEFPSFDLPIQVEEGDLSWSQVDAGEHLRFRRLVEKDGKASAVSLGQLSWNKEFCRIVVIDGQHRSMALLAIDRTVRSTWQDSGGARYRYFYESRVKELLKQQTVSLEDVEVPVTILWFPDKFGAGQDPHKSARKLFVDVNKEARTPSESRLILLSDSEMINIFTRATLTMLRNVEHDDAHFLPLYCVEYDNPDTKTTQSARWSALTNIHVLKQMVTRVLFGPTKYIDNVKLSLGKREPEENRNAFMRTQLSVDTLFPPTLEGDEPFPRDKLGNVSFPESAVEKLAEAYGGTWGTALLVLLSEVLPFKAHATALANLKQGWLPDDAIATLAHDALFSGVGMYWTLRDSSRFYQEEKAVMPTASAAIKPDVVKAWNLIESKQSEFESLRAMELLGNKGKKDTVNQLYQAINTHACQLGLALTLASVFKHATQEGTDVVALARVMAAGINSWMGSKVSGEYDRRLALSKRRDGSPKYPLNVISNMDAPRAVQFRYFWLEILSAPQSVPKFGDLVDVSEMQRLRDEAREAYVEYVAGEKEKAIKTSSPDTPDQVRREQARSSAMLELKTALKRWFGMSAQSWDSWADSATLVESELSASAEQDGADGEADANDFLGEPDETVEIDDLVEPS